MEQPFLMISKVLDQYEVFPLLGKGGTGEIHQAGYRMLDCGLANEALLEELARNGSVPDDSGARPNYLPSLKITNRRNPRRQHLPYTCTTVVFPTASKVGWIMR